MATVNPFVAVSNPLASDQQWTGISNYGIRDSVTGDLVFWSYNSVSTTPIALYSSQNNSASWTRLATDATNPLAGTDKIYSAVQDSTGAVHCYTYDYSGNGPGYGRLNPVRSGGHVIGYTWAVTPFSVPNHAATAHESRGCIHIFNLGGVETIVYVVGGSVGDTDLLIYAARATSLTPSSAADFVGLDGTGSDSVLLNVTDITGTRFSHTHQPALAQIGSTEDLYLVVGPFDADQAVGPQGTISNSDLWCRQLPKSAGVWTVGSSSSLGTNILAAASGVTLPTLLGVAGNSSRVWVQYTDGNNGVCFAYIDSAGAVHANAITSPLSTAGRVGYGAFNVSAANEIWTVFNTFGAFGSTTPTGKLAHWDGSTWETNTTDASAVDTIAFISFRGWSYGCAAVRVPGDPNSQVATGLLSGAAVFTPPGPTITLQPTGATVNVGGTATLTVAATGAGTVTYQWQSGITGSFVNIAGATSASYTTAALAANQDADIRCNVTDTNGTVASIAARVNCAIPRYSGLRAGIGARSARGIRGAFGRLVNRTAGLMVQSLTDEFLLGVTSASIITVNANATAQAAGTADLLKGVSLAGAALSVVTATAGVSHTVPLAATAVGQVTDTGQLALTIAFGATAVSSTVAVALMSLAKPMAAAAAAQAAATADMSIAAGGSAVSLAAAATDLATAAADLAKVVGMTVSALSASAATADISKGSSLGAAASSQDAATGALDLQEVLSATANAQSSVTALMFLGKALAANATAQGLSTADLSTSASNVVNLASTAVANATAGAVLSLAVNLSASALAQATSAAALANPAALAASAISNAQATAALAVGKPLSGFAQMQSSSSATLLLQVPISAAALAQAVSTGALTIKVLLDAAGLSSSNSSAALSGPIKLTAGALSVASLGATLQILGITNQLKHSRSAHDVHRLWSASDVARRWSARDDRRNFRSDDWEVL